jgi:ATP-binding cassette subfamily C (CFTR/MRP) protein 1
MNNTCLAIDNSFGPSAGDCHGSIDFTLVFESSILTILPAALLIVITPIRVYFLQQTSVKVKSSLIAHLKPVS